MKITQFFMRRATLFWSLMVAVVVAGVIAFIQMPKLEDPAVAVKQAMVAIPYPGASAHEVELDVAVKVEDALRALPDVKKIKTECHTGMASFTVEFLMTVPLADLEQHFDLLRRKVNDLRSSLPSGCYDPVVVDDMMDVYGIFYALKGDGYTYPEMYQYAKMIRRALLAVPGVKRVNIVGNRDEVINIQLSKEQLSRNGLIPVQIMAALNGANQTVDAGVYPNGDDRLRLAVSGNIRDEEDIRQILIQTTDGKQVRLGDIAHIERTYAEPQRNGFFVSGKPALAICLAMEADAIVPDVGRAVDEKLAEVMKQVPAGMETEKVFFQPDKVDEAISALHKALTWDPKYLQARATFASALYMKGEYEKSAEMSRMVIQQEPSFAPAWNNLSLACFELGDVEKAKEYAEKACEFGYEVSDDYWKLLEESTKKA